MLRSSAVRPVRTSAVLVVIAFSSILLGSSTAAAGYCESSLALVDDNFSGGNVGACEFTADRSLSIVITPEDAPPINPSAWYSFRLSPKQASTFDISLKFVDGHARYLPKLSEDGDNWVRMSEESYSISDDRSTLFISLDERIDPVFISAQELMVADDYEQWMHSLSAHPELKHRTLGRSVEGRPIQALITQRRPEVVYLFGRQHPPEITGGIAMQHFVNAVFDDTPLARRFRERFMIVLVPLINPDGVEAGHWRHNLGGRDLNRDWGPFTQPETQSIKRLIDELDADGIQPRLMLDFHSTQRSRFYTQMPEDFDEPLDFARDWLDRSRERLPEFDFLYDPRKPSGQENTKNFFFATYHIPAITYEVGDEVSRELIAESTPIFAEEMMQTMLERAASGQ